MSLFISEYLPKIKLSEFFLGLTYMNLESLSLLLEGWLTIVLVQALVGETLYKLNFMLIKLSAPKSLSGLALIPHR